LIATPVKATLHFRPCNGFGSAINCNADRWIPAFAGMTVSSSMASLSSSFSAKSPLVLVGAGKMGAALLKGWLDGGLDRKAVVVVDPAPPGDSAALLAAAGVRDQPKPPKGIKAKVIVVAVKPQIIGDVLPGLRSLVGRGTVTLSIAAGTTLANLAAGIGEGAIVRSIPNTPAQVGRGITAAIANDRVSKAGRALVTRLLEAVGEVVWVDDEDLIDAVTAVSGSGPAYVFWLTECLAEAAVAAGLDADSAARLARATVTGAGELRKNVTSPKGTTAAALKVLMAKNGLAPLMKKAVAAAKKRSRELSG
jgi:pyrroline-5-carboxylate reductase